MYLFFIHFYIKLIKRHESQFVLIVLQYQIKVFKFVREMINYRTLESVVWLNDDKKRKNNR